MNDDRYLFYTRKELEDALREKDERFNEAENILRGFLTTIECRETWIEEMRGTIDAFLNENKEN